ncbi:hypothetical protein BN3087_840009 [Sulfurovum sp. enrichment culture clone C5]|uniref:Lipoprotein n=1 Tax=Sulfurovum sp. enrichment culture clone C5 TaxID=497650 RepID=A0A0S4XQ66_9BACT|nr:hypothetical protein BN3087_840009 [Sulfurovum sp. enrichment culture clone C5]
MRKIFIYSLMLLFATGCIEVAPQEVHQDVKISKNKTISITYDGTFMDLYDVFVTMDSLKHEQSNDLPNLDEYQKSIIKMLRESKLNKKAYKISGHTFYAKWQEDANISYPNPTPSLLSSYGNEKIPKILTLNSMQISSSAFHFSYDEIDPESKEPTDEWLKNLIKKYALGYKGKVSITIDSDLVLKSNATTTTKLSDGTTLYEWSDLKFEDKESKIDFVFSFDPMDKDRYKLTSAPVGTSCKSLIGTDCKCGPFVLYSYGGYPLSYRGYVIKSNNITKKGCSDKDGNVPSITSKITGNCTITMLNEKESSKLCGNKKIKH